MYSHVTFVLGLDEREEYEDGLDQVAILVHVTLLGETARNQIEKDTGAVALNDSPRVTVLHQLGQKPHANQG